MFNKSRFGLFSLSLIAALLLVALPVAAQDTGSTIEFTGTINAIDGTTVDVGGVVVDIGDLTTDMTFEIDMVIKVEGTRLDDGTVVAHEVSPVNTDDTPASDTLELIGTLDSLDASTAVVGGMEFDITGATIEPGLVIGELVEVRASLADDGSSWFASKIERHDDTGADSTDDSNTNDDSDPDSPDDVSDDSGSCTFKVEVASANLRSGPGTGSDVVGFAYEDDEFSVLEIDANGSWIMVGEGQWLAVSTGELEGNCIGLPVSDEILSIGSDDSHDDSSVDSPDDGSDDSSDDSHDDSSIDSSDDSHDDGSDDGSDDNHDDSSDDSHDDSPDDGHDDDD